MRVVDQRKNIGLSTLGDLADYYRQFVVISTFLRAKDRISKDGETRRFMEGFPAHMAERVKQRLQVLHPHHDQDEEHAIADVEQAAEYVLHGTTNAPQAAITSTRPRPRQLSSIQTSTYGPRPSQRRSATRSRRARRVQHIRSWYMAFARTALPLRLIPPRYY